MNKSMAAAREFFSQRRERGEPDFFLSPAFKRSSFLSAIISSARRACTPGRPAVPVFKPEERLRPDTFPEKNRVAAHEIVKPARPAVAPGKREALKQLYFAMGACQRCALGKTRTKLVFGSGNAQAAIMVIGEAPGADEDSQGLPFVGKAGQLLTQMLLSINLDRAKDLFITNVVKCRPPQNRNPQESEIAACRDYLERQIEIIQPRIILLLGRVAASALLGASDGIGHLRTGSHAYKDIPVVLTYHPAALLRKAEYTKPFQEDLQKLSGLLRQLGLG
jgi:DNA polymerase